MLRKLLFFFVSLNAMLMVLAQPNVYELPGENVYPEGIAHDPGSNSVFVTSTSDGTIFQVDVETGEVNTFVPGSEGMMFSTIGLAVDEQNRLWVAGGGSGQVFLYDIETGERIAAFSTPEAEATFLNDVTVTSAGDAYITDSYRPVLFRVSADSDTVESWLDFTGTPFEYQEGFNANGIVATPDAQYLLVIQLNTGQLYRIDTQSKEVILVEVEGGELTNGDGLVLDGQTLYVVRNTNNEVAVVEMTEDFSSGTVTSSIQDASFAFPTTAAIVGDRLLIVNAQFDAMQTEEGPSLPFTVSSVPLPTTGE